ncbi:hypothetical protein MKEN_01476500 [Mycena kentingensis (nom. inval.)]|nr:hypothetical protein MKEN_01476500 [Mycena kentingensis (nom. inval.)]
MRCLIPAMNASSGQSPEEEDVSVQQPADCDLPPPTTVSIPFPLKLGTLVLLHPPNRPPQAALYAYCAFLRKSLCKSASPSQTGGKIRRAAVRVWGTLGALTVESPAAARDFPSPTPWPPSQLPKPPDGLARSRKRLSRPLGVSMAPAHRFPMASTTLRLFGARYSANSASASLPTSGKPMSSNASFVLADLRNSAGEDPNDKTSKRDVKEEQE